MKTLVDAFGAHTGIHDEVVITSPTGYRTLIMGEVVKVNSKTVTVQYLDYRNTTAKHPEPKLTTIHLPSSKFMLMPTYSY